MKKPQPITIVMMPVSWPGMPETGSLIRNCVKCDEPGYITPYDIDRYRRNGHSKAHIICAMCADPTGEALTAQKFLTWRNQ